MKPVYFYCLAGGKLHSTAYQHQVVCLAEGLRLLGVRCVSNVPYWQEAPGGKHLLEPDETVRPEDASVVVINQYWRKFGHPLPDSARVDATRRAYRLVYLDDADGFKTNAWEDEFRRFDFVFRSHMTEGCKYPANFTPWPFGLSSRLIDSTAGGPVANERAPRILRNYRVGQHARNLSSKYFLNALQAHFPLETRIDGKTIDNPDEWEQLMWRQTGRRHNARYFEALRVTRFSACFGGFFLPPDILMRPPFWGAWNVLTDRFVSMKHRPAQWDSWRWWESLSAGCVALQLDFNHYGMVLPVRPRNWEHYVGVTMTRQAIPETIERILAEPETMDRISVQSRAWAVENYGPLAVARRFLDLLELSPS